MMSSYISTLAWTSPARNAIPRLQSELSRASTELSTGRHADVGLTLGVRSAESVGLYLERGEIDSMTQSNAQTRSFVDRTQMSLAQLTTDASAFLKELVVGQSDDSGGQTVQSQAKLALSAFISSMNASDGQRYLFAGVNSAVQPLADYETSPKTAVNSAFATKFGLSATDPQNDPAVSQIAASDMEAFLDNEFADLFADPAWGTAWSSASSTNLTSRISSTERVTISANANAPAMRNLAMALTMVAELGTANLSDSAREVVLKKATGLAGGSITSFTGMATSLGVSQIRLDVADEAMRKTLDVVNSRVNALEGVDPAEAKTRMDTLSTQLEMSYATTAKIMQLSILNYV